MKKYIIKELSIWMISALIALIAWYPIFSRIDYKYLLLGVSAITMIIQFFRWFVFYDHVILFQRKRYILLSIFSFFAIGSIVWSQGQEVMLIAENQIIEDLIYPSGKKVTLGLEETYKMFEYLRNLLVFCNFVTPGLAMILIFKIIYKTIGMGSQKVKSYIEKKN